MQIKATVHTVAPIKVPTEVTDADGNKLIADVPMLAVEFVTDGGDRQKNPMLNAPMGDESWLEAGARVTITIAPEAGDKTEKAK